MRFIWRIKRFRYRLYRQIRMVSASSACEKVYNLPFLSGNKKFNGLRNIPLLNEAKWAKADWGSNLTPFVGKGHGWFYDTRRRILINSQGRVIRDSVNTSIIPWVSRKKGYRYSPRSADLRVCGPAMILRTQSDNYYHILNFACG